MSATVLEPPIKVITRTMSDLECEIEPRDVWAWVRKLSASGFLITIVPGGLFCTRDRQTMNLRVRQERE